MSDG
jgi:hypothetical protein